MIDPLIQQTDPYDILIVDDTPESLELLGRILDEHGYRVRPAANGRHALKSVAARLPELILLDVKMPGMDGFEVCRRLKANEKSRNVPVIFISAHGETAKKVEGFKAGGVDFVTKPFEREEVLARVDIHLRLNELTEHLEQLVDRRTRQLRHEIAEHQRTGEILQIKDYIIESASSVI
ncbi:MAG: response regulator, partial [Desulfobacteraceae bacterium]